MPKLSAIVITKNEAESIERCLGSLGFADEIIVVDAQSEDETVKLASRFTDQIYVREWMGFAASKQFAADKAQGPWIMWLDADEVVTPELAREIQVAIIDPGKASGFRMPRKAWFLGRWILHSGWYPGHVLRLFLKDAGQFTTDRVHERLIVTGEIAELKGEIEHYTDRSIEHYFTKFNRYTSLAAADLLDKGRRFKTADLIIRPVYMFIKMYIFKAGFLDGRQGFILAVLSAYYVFTKYAKLWDLRANQQK